MKRLVLTCILTFAVAAGGLAQGLIAINNNWNTSHDRSATSNGLFWYENVLLNEDFNLTLLGGPDDTSLVPVKTFLLSDGTAIGSSMGGPGTWTDMSGGTYPVPGVAPGATAYFEVLIWLGNYSSYFAAGGGRAQSTVFTQVLGGGILSPPDLSAMPAVVIQPIPEPSISGLASLGAALWLCRRRK